MFKNRGVALFASATVRWSSVWRRSHSRLAHHLGRHQGQEHQEGRPGPERTVVGCRRTRTAPSSFGEDLDEEERRDEQDQAGRTSRWPHPQRPARRAPRAREDRKEPDGPHLQKQPAKRRLVPPRRCGTPSLAYGQAQPRAPITGPAHPSPVGTGGLKLSFVGNLRPGRLRRTRLVISKRSELGSVASLELLVGKNQMPRQSGGFGWRINPHLGPRRGYRRGVRVHPLGLRARRMVPRDG